MTGKTKNEIAIGDLHIAAYLVVKGIPLDRVERSGRLGNFYFAQSAASLLTEYYSRNGSIEPQAFVSAIRNLKARVDAIQQGVRP